MNLIQTLRNVTAVTLFCTFSVFGQETTPQPVPAPATLPVEVQPATPALAEPQPAPSQPAVTATAASAPAPVIAASDEPKFHFGFKLAPTMAWLKADSKGLESDGSKVGFSYGITTEFKFQENYAFVTGLQVTYRGGLLKYRYADNAANPLFAYDLNLQFLEIPITLKMKTNEFGKIRYFGQFGLDPGFLLNAKVEPSLESSGSNGGWAIDTEYEEDFKEYINGFNLSMIIAAGLEYKLAGNTVLFTSIEFNNGFVDIFGTVQQPIIDQDPNNPPPREVKWAGFTNFFALNLGILF